MRIGGGNRALIGIAACVGLVLVAMYVDGQHRPSAQALAPDTKRAVQAVPVRVPAPVRWSTTTVMLPVGTLMRSYLLVRPETLPKRRLPVMVVLHGRTATPEIERKRTGFPE